MLRHMLVPTLTLLLVLAAPSGAGAAATADPPRSGGADEGLAVALSELRDLIALWIRPAARGTASAAESGGSGTGGPGGEGHSGYDPNGANEDPEPAEGLQTGSNGAAG